MSLKLPSTVTDVEYLRMPPEGYVVDSDEEWEKCGKWILPIPKNDLTWADNVWTDLQALLNNGRLLLLKTSTAYFKETETGSIMCFTRPGQEEARKAAEAIREAILRYDYKYVMFYKLVKDTNEQRDRRHGVRYVSQYLHTVQGGFYARDANQRLILVREPEISRKKPVYPQRTSALKRLPSTEEKIEFKRNSGIGGFRQITNRSVQDEIESSSGYLPEKGYWHFKCSLEREEDGPTEADRVWIEVKILYDKKRFERIVSFRDDRIVNIKCYVSGSSNVPNLVDDCKCIIRNTHFSAMSNFFVRPYSINCLKYVLTPEQELYETVHHGKANVVEMKFISDKELSHY